MELLKLYKNLGETPLECLERFRAENPKYKDIKMTYAGRLDPMAEGLLLILAGNTKEKDKYLSLNKTYEFEVLLGVDTDTYDILGLVKNVKNDKQVPCHSGISIWQVLEKIKNIKAQKYPPFSSRTVLGIPLFAWVRRNKLNDIAIPTKNIEIFDIQYLKERNISKKDLLKNVISRIDKVKGDFRQKEIVKSWRNFLEKSSPENFVILSLVANVSSGTYIRGLVHEMGKMLGNCAIAYSIKRTRVGKFVL